MLTQNSLNLSLNSFQIESKSDQKWMIFAIFAFESTQTTDSELKIFTDSLRLSMKTSIVLVQVKNRVNFEILKISYFVTCFQFKSFFVFFIWR